jgi:RimJ/RimL family protein N-acetyltransferase
VLIEQFDPRTDEKRLRVCHQIAVSAGPQDDPSDSPVSLRWFRSRAYGYADDPQQAWLATDDAGQPVGYYLLRLPERENRHNAFCNPVVAPARRRQGFGGTLLAHAAGQAQRCERTLLTATRVGPPGTAFAQACGARPGLQDVRRVLDIDADLRGRLGGLRAEALAYATGYSLRSWSGPTPDDLVEQACALNNAMEDAPHDALEPEAWDAERLQEDERRSDELGFRRHSVAAFAEDSGEMAALTYVDVDPDTAECGRQRLTAVTRPHRGHRLGKLTKVAMLDWLASIEPQLQRIVTHNAAQNQHMIAVNDALGHRISAVLPWWEIDVAVALMLRS